jgi:hypothetical protein
MISPQVNHLMILTFNMAGSTTASGDQNEIFVIIGNYFNTERGNGCSPTRGEI